MSLNIPDPDKRPKFYTTSVTVVGTSVAFTIPDDAVSLQLRVRVGGDVLVSTDGTAGSALSPNTSGIITTTRGLDFPLELNNVVPRATELLFDVVATGTVPAVVEVVVS